MAFTNLSLRPAQLLVDHSSLFNKRTLEGTILDLAGGDGHNGIFLASRNLPVICCDISREILSRARKLAAENSIKIKFWQVDLEGPKMNPFSEAFFGFFPYEFWVIDSYVLPYSP